MKKTQQFEYGDDATAADAKRALLEGSGHEQALTQYMRDLGLNLTLIAKSINFRTATSANSKKQQTAQPEREDWEGSRDQIKVAIRAGATELVESYLRDAADVLMRLSNSIDATSTSRGWRLKFAREGRGRKTDPNKLFQDSQLAQTVRFTTLKYGKQDATIAKIQELGDRSKRQTSTKTRRAPHSRAAIFRALKGSKPSRKK